MADEDRCGAPLWVVGDAPLLRCSERPEHVGRIHKHGGYLWLDDGSQDCSSTQKPEGASGWEHEARATDHTILHLRASLLALEWAGGNTKDRATYRAIEEALTKTVERRNYLLGILHKEEAR